MSHELLKMFEDKQNSTSFKKITVFNINFRTMECMCERPLSY